MKSYMIILPLALILCFMVGCQKGEAVAEEATLAQKYPIIDVHFHADQSLEETGWNEAVKEKILDWFPQNFSIPKTTDELIQKTLEMFDRYNIVKVVAFGDTLEHWKKIAPERIISGVPIFMNEESSKAEYLSNLRKAFIDGSYEVLGEFWVQPAGLKPSDSTVKPIFALAEELDVPVGLHMGPGPKHGKYFWPEYRVGLGNPLLLEETLSQHPKLRMYVMHAGYPFIDEMIGIMLAYPQVYVGISFISADLEIPRAAFHDYLKKLVEAGFEKRIMFGSDSTFSPEIFKMAIEGVESADFLTEEQKRDIFYNNAVRFFGLETKIQ